MLFCNWQVFIGAEGELWIYVDSYRWVLSANTPRRALTRGYFALKIRLQLYENCIEQLDSKKKMCLLAHTASAVAKHALLPAICSRLGGDRFAIVANFDLVGSCVRPENYG